MRLFVGVDLPGAVKDELSEVIERLRPAAPNAKWVPRDNLHLTLSFLGEVGEDRIAVIRDALRSAASRVAESIPTALGDAGAFPSPRRARVFWVGLGDPDARMSQAAEAVEDELEPLGFPPEKRPWTAHLTLARLRVPGDVSAIVGERVEPLAFSVEELTLFRSRLARPAPTYEPLERFPFGR